MRKRTQGQNLAEWERKKDEKDEKDWRFLIEGVIKQKDYEYLIELVLDGMREDYEMPETDDPIAQSIIERYSHFL